MAHRLSIIALALSAAIVAAPVAAQQAVPVDTARIAQCQYEAQVWAASVWHLDPRLKVPIYAALGWLVGRPGLFAVIGANAESPRERRMTADYTAWCLSGYAGEAPRPGRVVLEFF